MHLRDGTGELLDPEWQEFRSLKALQDGVLFTVRDLLSCDFRRGMLDLRFRIDAEDGKSKIVHTLPFKQALSIIPEGKTLPSARTA